MPLTFGQPTLICKDLAEVLNWEGNTLETWDGELFLTPDIYHYLCSLNRCYFFFVLRFLSLQTSGFPLKAGGSTSTFWLPRRDGTSSNTGGGYIVLLLSSFCWSVYICMWRPGQDFVLPLSQGLHFSIVCYPFCYLTIPVGLVSSVSILSSLDAFAGTFPFETFLTLNYCLTLVYNLINCHLWNARARLLPYRFQIFHFSPTLSLLHKTRSSCFHS